MSELEKDLQATSAAHLITIAWRELGPMFEAQRKFAIARLTQDFRAGKRAEDLYPHVAMLIAIEDLETDARSKILKGEVAARKLNNV